MADYIPELYALISILSEQKTYGEALFKINQEEQLSQAGKKKFTENVLGVLRHYFCLSFECLDLLPYAKDSEEHILALIPLFELRYHKDVTREEIYACYHDAFIKERLMGDARSNFKVLEEASKTAFKIPDEVKSSPYLYNSLVLELPDFFLKRMSKDYGAQNALNIASYLHKKPYNFFGPTPICKQEELLSNDAFENVSLDDGTILYSTNKPLSIKEVRSKGLYPFGYLEALAYSKLPIPALQPKILLTGLESGSQILPLCLKTLDTFESKVDAVYQDALSYRSAVDVMKKFKLKNAHIINTKLALVKTYVKDHYYDVVVSFGKDCKIGLARRMPSVLPCLRETDFLKSKKRQVADLLEMSSFVKEGGYLLFINHSLDKEESNEVVLSFLSQRKEFTTIHKEMVFPNIMDCDAGYYAILKRKQNQHD
ncbi:MAG: hypothetical protein K5762_02675 [Bacilli bacterium]|nr:hypothetical protein [Bacilli bacterium]